MRRVLIIDFRQIFLFVFRRNGLSVLAPGSGHQCWIDFGTGWQQLNKVVLTLLKNGQPVPGVPFSAVRYMVSMEDVLGHGRYVVKSNKDLDHGPAVARFELGGDFAFLLDGPKLQLPNGTNSSNPEFEWNFTFGLSHRLTDQAQFVLPLEEGARYELNVVDSLTGNQQTPIAISDTKETTTISVEMRDAQAHPSPEPVQLLEFGLLYQFLLDKNGQPITQPIPSSAISTPEREVALRRRISKNVTDSRLRHALQRQGKMLSDELVDGVAKLLANQTIDCIEPVCPNAECSE